MGREGGHRAEGVAPVSLFVLAVGLACVVVAALAIRGFL